MKERLLELIHQTEEIEKEFHTVSGDPIGIKMIGDVQKFTVWLMKVKAELTKLYDKTHDKFVWNTINLVSVRFDGYEDQRKFDKIKGALYAIADDIDTYFPQEKNHVIQFGTAKLVGEPSRMKKPKIFISHSSKDVEYATRLTELFDSIGLTREQIFCSSVPGYNIPIDKDIFEYLREQFGQYNLHVFFVLSHNYYDSVVCLNEMGAAWALRSKSTTILLPDFNFNEIEGVVSKDRIAIKLTAECDDIKDKLNQLYENIIEEFGLSGKVDIIWEKKRTTFIDNVLKITNAKNDKQQEKYKTIISQEAIEILKEADKNKNGEIIITANLQSGKTINYGNKCHSEAEGRREFSKWEAAIDELITLKFIEARGKKGEIFVITNAGYNYLSSIGEQ